MFTKLDFCRKFLFSETSEEHLFREKQFKHHNILTQDTDISVTLAQ
jgi:hypothetical protein